MIMGAGMGLRMRPLTDDRPKPLVTVGGKRIVVNLHYRGEMLRGHLARRRDAEIIFSDETDKLLDTGGGVVKALPLLGHAPFFILNSDSIWVESIAALPAMIAEWDAARMDGLLLLADMHTAMGYEGKGDFEMLKGGQLERAREHAG